MVFFSAQYTSNICVHIHLLTGTCIHLDLQNCLEVFYTSKHFILQYVSLQYLKFLHLILKVMQANGLDERTNLLVEEYSTSGRLDNITQVMSIHTQYLESFLRSQFYMLRMDGPLPLPYRHYIAIMVCANGLCIFSHDLDFLLKKEKGSL